VENIAPASPPFVRGGLQAIGAQQTERTL